MADAFKGLTIRIGADTRPLNSALSSVRNAAGLAQREMNKLTKALRFNPSDTAAMSGKISLLEDKLHMSAKQANLLKESIKNAGAQIKRMSGSTRDVFANAERVRSGFTSVNSQLETMYDAIAKFNAKAKGVTFEEAKEDLRSITTGLESSAEKMKALRSILTSMSNKGAAIPFTDKRGIGAANEAIGTIKRLRAQSKQLNAELETANFARSFRTAQLNLVAMKAEMRETAMEAARMRSALYSAGTGSGIRKTTDEMLRLDSVIEKTRERARAMSEVYDGMPHSIEAAKAKMNSLEAHSKTIADKAKVLHERMKQIENVEGFDKISAAAGDCYNKISKLESAYANNEVKLKELAAAYDRTTEKMREMEALSGNAKRSSRYKTLEREAEGYRREMEKVRSEIHKVDTALDNANLEKEWLEARDSIRRYEAELDRLSGKYSKLRMLGNMGGALRTAGYAAYSTVTPALMMMGRYAITAANDVDTAYRNMRKTVQGTDREFEQLKDAALEYGRTHVTSADKILEIESIGGQLGITVDKLEGFATTVSNLDIATNMETEDIAADLGKMGSVMGLTTEEYDHFADSLVRLGNSEPAFESDIMTIATRFMGMGKVVGMSSDQMLAWSTAATATGQKSEAAGSSMQRFISNIENAVVNGGKKLDTFARVAGMSSEEFQKSFGNSASDTMYKFVEGLGEIQKSGGSVNQVLGELGINNVRDKQLLEGFAQQMANATNENNVLRDSLKMSEDAWNGISDRWGDAGDAAREAQKKSEGFSGQLQIMKNNAQALAVELGEGAAPWLEKINGIITMLSGAFSGMSQGTKSAIVGIAGVAAASGPLLVAVGSTAAAVSNIVETARKVPTAFAKIRKVMQLASIETDITASSCSTFSSSMGGAAKSTSKASKAISAAVGVAGMGGVSIAIAGIAVAAAAAVISISELAEHFQKLKEHEEKLQKSSKTLSSLFKDMGIKNAEDEIEPMVESTQQMRVLMEETADANEDMANTLSKRFKQIATDSEELDRVTDKIMELGSKTADGTELTEKQVDELRTAVNAFNEINGTSYMVDDIGIIRDEAGEVANLADAFERAANSKKMLWQAEAMEDAYNQLSNSMKDTADQIRSQQDLIDSFYERARNATSEQEQNAALAQAEDAKKVLRELEAQYNDLEAARNRLLDNSEIAEMAAENSKSIEALVTSYDQYGDALEHHGMSARDLTDTLYALGMGYDDLKGLSSDAWKNIEENWTGGLPQLIDMLDKSGVKLDDQSAKLLQLAEDAGVSGSQLADIWEKSGYDVDTLVQNLNKVKEANGSLDGTSPFKQMEIDIEGASIAAQSASGVIGAAINTLNGMLADGTLSIGDYSQSLAIIEAFKMSPKSIRVTDEGTIEVVDEKLRDCDYLVIGDKKFKVDDNGTISIASGKVENLKGKIGTIPATKTVTVTADTSSADRSLTNLLSRFASASAKEFALKVKAKVSRGATGTFTDFPITKAVPAHAAGGITGIVTQPTMTNWGLVGEAGAEALVRWARGTAVVPLQNHHYVRPFAQTIASEMGGTQQPVNVTNVYLNDIAVNNHPAIMAATEEYLGVLARYTAMGGR